MCICASSSAFSQLSKSLTGGLLLSLPSLIKKYLNDCEKIKQSLQIFFLSLGMIKLGWFVLQYFRKVAQQQGFVASPSKLSIRSNLNEPVSEVTVAVNPSSAQKRRYKCFPVQYVGSSNSSVSASQTSIPTSRRTNLVAHGDAMEAISLKKVANDICIFPGS